MIYSTFSALNLHRNSFVATKDKYEVEIMTSNQLQKGFDFLVNKLVHIFNCFCVSFSLRFIKIQKQYMKRFQM